MLLGGVGGSVGSLLRTAANPMLRILASDSSGPGHSELMSGALSFTRVSRAEYLGQHAPAKMIALATQTV